MLREVWEFLINPIYREYPRKDLNILLPKFVPLLGYALLLSYGFGILNSALQSILNLDIGDHASEEFINGPTIYLFGMAVILAPLMEETIFRGPLIFLKESLYFKPIFYVITLLFGFYHILNFELTPTTLWVSPLLVAPQISVGIFLGFVRVRFNLLWAIFFHALYNFILMTPLLLFKLLEIPIK